MDDPDFDAAVEFRSTLTDETDRGCALMAAAYLDDRLAELLKAYFVDDLRVAKKLLEPTQPLGAFSVRIDVVYLLGLLSREHRKALHLIRKIRNDFGHVAKPISFRDQVIADRCKNLEHLSFVKRSSHRAMFNGAVMAVLAAINVRLRKATHREMPKDIILSKIVHKSLPLPEAQGFPLFADALIAYVAAKPEGQANALGNLRAAITKVLGIDPTNEEEATMFDKLMTKLAKKISTADSNQG